MIDLKKYPKRIQPLSADNLFIFSETTTNDCKFIVSIDANDYEIYPNPEGIAMIDMRYVLEDRVKPILVTESTGLLSKIDLTKYHIIIKSYKTSDGSLISTNDLSFYYTFYGDSEDFNLNEWLNSYRGGVSVYGNDKLYIQAITGNFTGINKMVNLKIVQHSRTSVKTTIKTMNLLDDIQITNINISPVFLNIDADTIYYTVQDETGFMDVVTVNMIQSKLRYPVKRFRWVNDLGATDYLNCIYQSSHIQGIERGTYMNNGTELIYKNEKKDEYSVITDYMSEQQSYDIASLWGSPVVESDKKSVILLNNKVKILNKKQNKSISYEVKYKFAHR